MSSSRLDSILDLFPGIWLSAGIGGLALIIEAIETRLFSHVLLDGLVIAILFGIGLRSWRGLPPRFAPGVDFSARTMLEVAIVLLGASISFSVVGRAGPWLLPVVAGVVLAALTLSYGAARLFGLPDKLATLVACGNAICGNSAIMAAAPVIHADTKDVAASIAFTAALGIAVVLILPLVPALFGMSQQQYGILAGMTVYAVPQVLAATAPVGLVSAQVGALVKLMRVLMLGPVLVLLSLKEARLSAGGFHLSRLVPWFIIGFMAMMTLRSMNLIPPVLLPFLSRSSEVLTVAAMAALGLSVDLRSIMSAGGRVLAAGVVSLLLLACLSVGAIWLLGGAHIT